MTPACVAAVLAYNGKAAVKLDKRLYAMPLGQLLEQGKWPRIGRTCPCGFSGQLLKK